MKKVRVHLAELERGTFRCRMNERQNAHLEAPV